MTRNLLDEFRINVLNSKLNPKTRDSFVFDDKQIDFSIKILKDFFKEKVYIVNPKITQNENSGLNANENWITYHLAQSEHSVGSILVILEITGLIHYFSNSSEAEVPNKN